MKKLNAEQKKLKMLKKTKNAEKTIGTNAEKNWKMLKKLDTIVYHPNNYTGSELFWENLTQYSIPTLIGTQHYHNTHQTRLVEHLPLGACVRPASQSTSRAHRILCAMLLQGIMQTITVLDWASWPAEV